MQDRLGARVIARASVVLAALIAVLIQALVVQTHSHPADPFAGFAIERAADHDAPGHAHVEATHEQAGCITCVAFAAGGISIAPGAAALAAFESAASQATALAIRRAPRALTHSWRSRAPPIAL